MTTHSKRITFGTAAILALCAPPAWAVCAPMGGRYFISTSVQIKGTHYDATGNVTKLKCDTETGDSISVMVGGSTPPTLTFQLWSTNPACAPLSGMTNQFATFGPWGSELQVVKNGIAKRECVFHGVCPWWDLAEPSFWAANTVRKFNSAGDATAEKGSFTLNTPDGQIFIGKIKIKYP